MGLSDADRAFVDAHVGAGMVTVTPTGVAKVARVAVTLVDGKLWSSGTEDRVRTKRLRADARCTLYVSDASWSWLGLETTVTILEGSDAAANSVRLFRQMQRRPEGRLSWFGKELAEEEFLALMAEEKRLIYEFEVHRTYGMR